MSWIQSDHSLCDLLQTDFSHTTPGTWRIIPWGELQVETTPGLLVIPAQVMHTVAVKVNSHSDTYKCPVPSVGSVGGTLYDIYSCCPKASTQTIFITMRAENKLYALSEC